MAARGEVVIENARLIFRNFTGKGSEFNQEGTRNFGVILPEEIALPMLQDGFNVKRLKPSDEEKEQGIEEGPYWVSVRVRYDAGAPPQITVLNEEQTRRTNFDEEMVDQLDWAEIARDPRTEEPLVDLIIRAFHWEKGGRSGVAAYLKTMFITIVEDPLQAKYANMQAGQTPQG